MPAGVDPANPGPGSPRLPAGHATALMLAVTTADAVDAVYRIESARLIAGVTRIVRDVGIAEELAQDALVAALEQWPESGVPDKPGAWLMAVAKHRAIDLVRRKETYARKLAEVGRTLTDVPPPEPPDPNDIDDDLLRLIFTACHPVLPTRGRIALTLRLVGGLTTEEIARAFLVSAPTVAQRVVRAKRTLATADVPFEVPYGTERAERVESVLEVIYLIFNEGYSATAGEDWLRPALCEDALRLARVLAGLMPQESEVHGLAGLLELQASRTAARTASDGSPVLLADQNRSRWNRLFIHRGYAALAQATATAPHPGALGPFALQAAIAACHSHATRYEDTDWRTISTLYGRLAAISPSPVVELNRAVAVSMAEGPAAGLVLVDAVASEPALREYHLLPSVRGDMLERLGQLDAARVEFERAAALAGNARERTLLLDRAARCG